MPLFMENRLHWIMIVFFMLFFLQFAEYAFASGVRPAEEYTHGDIYGETVYAIKDSDGNMKYATRAELIELGFDITEIGVSVISPGGTGWIITGILETGVKNVENSFGFFAGIFDFFVIDIPDSPMIITIILSSINGFLIFAFAYVAFSFLYDVIKALPFT